MLAAPGNAASHGFVGRDHQAAWHAVDLHRRREDRSARASRKDAANGGTVCAIGQEHIVRLRDCPCNLQDAPALT